MNSSFQFLLRDCSAVQKFLLQATYFLTTDYTDYTDHVLINPTIFSVESVYSVVKKSSDSALHIVIAAKSSKDHLILMNFPAPF